MTREERAADNSTLAIGRVSSQIDSFVVAGSFVLRTNPPRQMLKSPPIAKMRTLNR